MACWMLLRPWVGARQAPFAWVELKEGQSIDLKQLIGRFVLIQQVARETPISVLQFWGVVGFWGVVSCSVLTWRDIYLFKLLSWTRHPEGRTSCVEFPWRQLHDWMKKKQGLNIRVYQSKIFKHKASLQDFCFSSFSHAFQAHGADTPSIAPGGLKVVVGSSNMACQKKRDEFLANEMGQWVNMGNPRIQNFLLKNQSRTSWFIRFSPGFCAFFLCWKSGFLQMGRSIWACGVEVFRKQIPRY